MFCSIFCDAQIIIDGKEPPKPINFTGLGKRNSVFISFNSILWDDKNQKYLPGYSDGLQGFNDDFYNKSLSRINGSFSLTVGAETGLTGRISLKSYLSYGRLITDILLRPDLIVSDQSKIFQLSTYGAYSLTKNPKKKLRFQVLFGPDFMFANKNAIIYNYVESDGATPADYNQKESVFEVAAVAGIELTLNFGKHFGAFANSMAGISLPGGGIKSDGRLLGLKYYF